MNRFIGKIEVKKQVIVSISFVVVIAAIVIVAYSTKRNPSVQKVDLQHLSSIAQTHKVGEKAEVGGESVTVVSTNRSNGDIQRKPPKGNQWVDLYVNVKNTRSDKRPIALKDVYLVDQSGTKYSPTSTDMTNRNSPRFNLLADLPVGASMSGWLGFAVPNGVTQLKLVYVSNDAGGTTSLVPLP